MQGPVGLRARRVLRVLLPIDWQQPRVHGGCTPASVVATVGERSDAGRNPAAGASHRFARACVGRNRRQGLGRFFAFSGDLAKLAFAGSFALLSEDTRRDRRSAFDQAAHDAARAA
jgi:hypothetical protein